MCWAGVFERTHILELIGFDTETKLIGYGQIAPDIICVQANKEVVALADGCLDEALDALFEGDHHLVAQNAAFDLTVIASHRPSLIPKIFEWLWDGRIQDTAIRERMLNLADHGGIENTRPQYEGDKGAAIMYSLADLVKKYLGVDLTDEKGEDSWRTNYEMLIDKPSSEWPEEALYYASQDTYWPVEVYKAQEERRADLAKELADYGMTEFTGERGPIDPLKAANHRTKLDFCLKLMTLWGNALDPDEVVALDSRIRGDIAPEQLPLLYEKGIITPAVPAMPYKNGAADKETGEPKMTKPKKEKVNQTNLKKYVQDLAEEKPDLFVLKYTEASERFPDGQLSVDSDWLADHASLDPVLEQYYTRQKTAKLLSDYLPKMFWPEGGDTPAPTIHAGFHALKRTGRTSSGAAKDRKKKLLYPSWNGQNPDPRIRTAVVARPDWLLFSVDYSGMELGTLAQTCLDFFGHSVMADMLNKGVGLHDYLGGQLAANLDPDFGEKCMHYDAWDRYQAFRDLKGGSKEDAKFFKHYRTFAKPTGLGYPGGLAEKTFVTYAAGTYGIKVDLSMAKSLKQLWLQTYPEMVEYLALAKSTLIDPRNMMKGEPLRYYVTPMGMLRSGATYCACANGVGLQSPSAEGATDALCEIQRESYADPDSCLYNTVRSSIFIHDEMFGEVLNDSIEGVNQRIQRIIKIMVGRMRIATPDVMADAEPALMTRWYKAAEPVYNEDGLLVPWEPA